MQQNLKVSVFVPSTFGENTPAESALVASVLDSVQCNFCTMFGGSTTIDGSGQWVNDSNEVVSEPVKIVYAFTDCDKVTCESFLLAQSQYVRVQLAQTCVLWCIEPAFYGLQYA